MARLLINSHFGLMLVFISINNVSMGHPYTKQPSNIMGSKPAMKSTQNTEHTHAKEYTNAAESIHVSQSTDTAKSTYAMKFTNAAQSTHVSEITNLTESTTTTESTSTAEFTQAMKFTNAAQSIHVSETTNSAESTQAMKLTKAAQSTHVLEVTYSTESTTTTGSTHVSESTQATKFTNAVKSTHISEITNLTESTITTGSINVTESTDSMETTEGNSCMYSSFKRIPLKKKLILGFAENVTEGGIEQCGRLCFNREPCMSFGFNTNTHRCYLYEHRVIAGSKSIKEPGLIYYWKTEDSCPLDYNYVPHINFCYKVYSIRQDHSAAFSHCERDGGYLVLLDSDDKIQYLWDTYNYTLYNHLVGGHQDEMNSQDGDERWSWDNGARIITWAYSQPDNWGVGEDCLILYYWNGSVDYLGIPTMTVNDINCSEKHTFICEIPINM